MNSVDVRSQSYKTLENDLERIKMLENELEDAKATAKLTAESLAVAQ